MTVYIYSTQYEIGEIICDHLSSLKHLCFNFRTTSDLTIGLHNLKIYPDLLILDYLSFNHDLFNLYNHFYTENIKIPVMFYNDPFITATTRAKHWLSQIQLLQSYCKLSDIQSYKNIFAEIQKIIESEELRPYIKLMQTPLPMPSHLQKTPLTLNNIQELQNDYINDFKERAKLPNNLFYLLSLMQQNKEMSLTAEDIKKLYERDGKSITEKSIKVLISKLRTEIYKDKKCKFILSNKDGLYSFIRFTSK